MREELNIKKFPIVFDYFKRYSYWLLDAANFVAPDKKVESWKKIFFQKFVILENLKNWFIDN